jgi:hypothetical protein
MTFEDDGDRFLSMAASALCGTALAGAMYCFLRDAIREYDNADESRAGAARSIAEICNDSDLSIPSASIRISKFSKI